MSRLICYLQRSSGGAALSGLVLVDARQQRTWSAPPPRPGQDLADAQRALVAAAARWIADQIGPLKDQTQLVLCLDADGARCAWLSAPSGEHTVVKAAVASAAQGGLDEDAPGPGVWDTAHGQDGLDMSVQSLSATAVLPKPRRDRTAIDRRERLAVLAIPDLAARLLLDELDRLDVEVAEVTSLWHAAALAWDPSATDRLSPGAMVDAEGAVVAESQPLSVSLLIEPAGRLVWAWCRSGQLVAAGSMRVRRIVSSAPAPEPEPAGEPVDDRAAPRLVGETSVEAPGAVLELAKADAGRLITEWLAWSIQLGQAPARIVCLGPSNIVCADLLADLPQVPGIAALAQTLGARWPGAAVTAQVEPDPVGATLARLVGAPPAGPADASGDPRAGLTDLASRPRRQTRTMFRWFALACASAALLVGVLAWKIERAAAAIRLDTDALRSLRAAEIAKIKDLIPDIEREADPVRRIRSRVIDMDKQRTALTPEPPVWRTLAAVLQTVEQVEGTRLKDKLRFNAIGGMGLTIALPAADAGPKFLDALRARSQSLGIDWSGQVVGTELRLSGNWAKGKPAAAAPASPAPGGGA